MAGHACLANLAQGTLCKILNQHELKPQKVRYYLERRDADFGNPALPAGSGEIGERFSATRRETLSRAPLRHGNHARSLTSAVEKTTRVNLWKRHLRYFAPLRASVLFTHTRGGMKQKYLPPREPS